MVVFFLCDEILCFVFLFFSELVNLSFSSNIILIAANKKEMTIINSVIFSIASIKKRKKY